MTDTDEPNLVTSGKSKQIIVDGYPFSIDIYRLEADTSWSLEVVDHEGTSHVWEGCFSSDDEALDAAITAIGIEGAVTFMRGNNVVPFRQR